jgi:hypothetical protein
MNRAARFFIVAILVEACAPAGGGISRVSTRDVLLADEIATTDAQNAYEAVSLKRPFFLQSRGPRSLQRADPGQTNEYPIVYLDRMYFGEIESLRRIPVQQIKEVQFLDANEATNQFGAGHNGGIILVLSRPG